MSASRSIQSVTVYCSSSSAIATIYFDAARELGCAIAAKGWKLIYGGNNVGLMHALAESVREGGGKVIGISPKLFCDEGVSDERCEEFIITADLRERRALMEQRGDAFIALPGGLGTLEEIIEIIVGKSLGMHLKPIVLVNVNDFWQPLRAMIERGIHEKFIKPRARELFFVASDVNAAMSYLHRGQG